MPYLTGVGPANPLFPSTPTAEEGCPDAGPAAEGGQDSPAAVVWCPAPFSGGQGASPDGRGHRAALTSTEADGGT